MTNSILEEGSIKIEKSSGIARIQFYHPMSNSLPGKLLAELANGITQLGKSDDINVIILSSHGEKAFCGGASFEELISIKDMEGGKQFFSGFANVINACRKSTKLIIGRVQGKAVGGFAFHNYEDRADAEVCQSDELFLGHFQFTPRLKRTEMVPDANEVLGHFKERMLGLDAASQIAAASVASFLPLLPSMR